MSKSTIRKDIDIINRALNVGKIGFGVVDSDGLIIIDQRYPMRKVTREQFEAEKKSQGCTELIYVVSSWEMKQ